MKSFKKDHSSFSIKKRLCPHCSNLCHPKATKCPKCGDPLQPLIEGENHETTTTFSKQSYNERDFVKSIELLIGKEIPKLKRIKQDVFGYKMNDISITGISVPKCNLKALPPLFSELPSLRAIFLKKSFFSSVPEQIKYMPSLQILNLN